MDRRRGRVQGKAAFELPRGLLTPSLTEANIQDSQRLRGLFTETARAASFKGSEICVVIPDECTRISFVTAETLPRSVDEQHTFLRWKLKKTVPFDVDDSQIAFRIVGTHTNGTNGSKVQGYDLLVALSPRSIIEEYENLLEGLDIHAGSIIPSTLAALNLVGIPANDALFVKVTSDSVTTTILQNRQIRFYRRVAELGLYESVFPTVLYYQDKLGGADLRHMIVCSQDAHLVSTIYDLQEKIGIPASQLEPRNVDDIYKPALGAVHLS